MALGDIVALGVGAPADIAHNVLFGLSPNPGGTPPSPPVTGGGYPITSRGTGQAWLHRDYRPPVFKRITRIRGIARPEPVLALARLGTVMARGGVGEFAGVALASPVSAVARLGEVTAVGGARAVAVRRKALTADEAFVLGYLAGQDDGD